jgi:hypothetical protein
MDEQPNPYEPPQVPAESGKPAVASVSPRAGGWWFAGLAILTLCGLFSMVPGLALLFLVLSAPVYIRYVKEFQSDEDLATRKPLSWMMRILATAAFFVGVAGAAAGAFFGTCTVTAWPVGLAATAIFNHYEPGMFLGVIVGAICGYPAFILVCIWLVRRQWEAPPESLDEKS